MHHRAQRHRRLSQLASRSRSSASKVPPSPSATARLDGFIRSIRHLATGLWSSLQVQAFHLVGPRDGTSSSLPTFDPWGSDISILCQFGVGFFLGIIWSPPLAACSVSITMASGTLGSKLQVALSQSWFRFSRQAAHVCVAQAGMPLRRVVFFASGAGQDWPQGQPRLFPYCLFVSSWQCSFAHRSAGAVQAVQTP